MSVMICPQCGTRYEGEHRFCTRDGASLVPENPADSLTGTVLADRYLVREKLGEGGMGEVYLAEHVRMKRKVAVKVMRKWLTSDAAAVGRFHREAENASQISHPNVAAVYDFGETSNGLVYLAMEYATGESLTKVLEREGALHHIRSADIVSQIAEALGAAHALGILHRDLKPDNVMIGRTRGGTDLVKLLDFGIARIMGRDTQAFTTAGLIVGTPEWMSPEQISGDQLDARSDIYSLGLMSFRMLTGEGPFSGGTSQEVMLAKMTKPPRRLSESRPEVPWPESLQEAFDRVLATDPAQRYAEATQFAADFYAGIAQLPMTAEADAYLQALSRRTATPAPRLGTLEGTPPYGVQTTETPARPRESFSRSDTPPVSTSAVVTPTPVPSATSGTFVPLTVGDAGATPPATEGASEESMVGEATVDAGGLVPPGDGAPAEPPRGRRFPLVPLLGAVAALVTAAILFKGGGPEPAVVGAADSTAADSAVTDSTVIVSAPSSVAAALDSVALRSRNSVFGVTRGSTRASGFLADSTGLVLTAATAVGGDSAVRVFLDAGRWVYGRVVAVDSASGLAALLIPTRHCPAACPPLALALAADTAAAPVAGDSVVAVYAPALSDRRRDTRGRITEATARRLSVSLRLPERGAGSVLLAPNGAVLGVARAASGSGIIAPVSAARALLDRARRGVASRRLTAIDLLPPSWPPRAVAENVLKAAEARSPLEIDAFRATGEGVEILVMTPQVLRWRKARADSLRQDFNPMQIGGRSCGPREICDPIEQWRVLPEFLTERRAVVVIQVSPDSARPPFIGERRFVLFRNGNVSAVGISADGAPVVPIESVRIAAVPNVDAYMPLPGATTPRSGARARGAFTSVLVMVRPEDLLKPGGVPRSVTLSISDETRRTPITVTLPASVLQAVAGDVGEFVRR